MSNEQPAEETKGQPEEVEAIRERIVKDLIQTLSSSRADVLSGVSGEPLRLFRAAARPTSEFHSLVFIDEHGQMHGTVTTIVAPEHHARVEEEAGQSFSEYLTQIDQSRERTQATQSEIDQLRIETKELIARLFAA
jgi:hypothetical protein